MAASWRHTCQVSPGLINDSSSDQDDEEGEKTLEMESIITNQNRSVEEVRGTPLKFPEQQHKGETETVDAEKTHPSQSSLPRPRPPPPIFSDSEDDEEYVSALSLVELEQSLQEVSFQVGTVGIPTSTPLPKKFQFKAKGVQENDRPEASATVTIGDDDDDSSSIDLLGPATDDDEVASRIDDNVKAQASGSSGRTNITVEVEDDSSESSDKENPPDVESPEVVALPQRIQPPKPKTALKTIFLDQLPPPAHGAKVEPTVSTSVIPLSTHNHVDRVLQSLKKTIELIPPLDAVATSPKNIRVDLYPHQAYGLQWLWWREGHFPGGGILADEMGLGKTVMILALILKSLEDGSPDYKSDEWRSNSKKLVPSKCTLIVVPPSVIGQWENEIKEKTRGLKYTLYHGPNRTKSAAELSRYHVVISTFQTVGSELPKQDERHYVSTSPLLKVNFERIVLDEGHIIRNEKTNAAFACCRIHAQHRWIVTGTPIHNKPADMHSLVKFIRLSPFEDSKLWDYWIGLNKLSDTTNSQQRLNVIGQALVLRRTKAEIGAVGNGPAIPPKVVKDIEVELTEGEREIYDHLEDYAKSVFKKFLQDKDANQLMNEKQKAADKFVAGPKAPKAAGEVSYTTIFTFILRLRQCCVLPYLIHSMIEEDDVDKDTSADEDLPEDNIISLRNPVLGVNYLSAKITRLLSDLKEIRDNCRGRPTMDKVVVVSQWKQLLDVIKTHLGDAGYRVCEINGKVKIGDRAGITRTFNTPSTKFEVMLLTLGAGGVGLNLVGGNHLFFMDLHWNPQLELQAQDRIHRFGQLKDVTIYRYTVKKTMEERVLELQATKLALAKSLLESGKGAGGGLSINEMRKLFNILT